MTLPSSIAITKAMATRASVAPRLKISAPLRASLTMASATVCGSGNRRGPASCAPMVQAMMRSASETSRAATFILPIVAGRTCRARARAPDPPARRRQSPQGLRTRRARRLLPRPAGAARCLPGSAGGRSRARRVAHTDARREPLPFGFRSGEYLLRLTGGVEEAVDHRGIVGCPSGCRTYSRQSPPARAPRGHA